MPQSASQAGGGRTGYKGAQLVGVDDEGRLVDDIAFLGLFLADADRLVGDLVDEPLPP